MKVLVTGATGFVGREVIRQLDEAGHSVRILARDPDSQRVLDIAGRFQVEVHCGNMLDAASLEGGLQHIDAVIHLVGIISEVGENTFENVHARGTENIVNAARKAGARRFIHMSALGTRPNAISHYHQSKWTAEGIVRRSGLDWTIFRPSIIYGPGDGFVNLFARMARFSPVLPVMGSGRTQFQPVAVESVAACFVKALNEHRAIGMTRDLCDTEVFTLEQILDLILEVTGRRRLKLRVPMWLVRCQAAALEFIFPRLLGKAPPLNRDQLLMLLEDNVGDPRPTMELFELEPVSFREGITKYLLC
ncbi:MAG TPA: complex I NDUFA9 subunit family protein [Candidatus Angelobacter sp.]|nr:complex I NDUFA9 subunit family protein [Candidatus Angelobacter sp.]